jgi:hypothetical protein
MHKVVPVVNQVMDVFEQTQYEWQQKQVCVLKLEQMTTKIKLRAIFLTQMTTD